MQEHTYTVVFEPAEEGGCIVRFPGLPGIVTEGEAIDEARAMARDAIRCYLEGLRKEGASIPHGSVAIVEELRVLLPEAV